MDKVYPVAAPALVGKEKEYVMDCLDTSWISSNGAYIERFEREFADFCHARYAVATSNGTTALHLALLAHGVAAGDEVIMPSFTFVATANAVTYCGAKPVFVDSEEDTWNMDPSKLEAYITPRTKGIIAVHIYGHPADMDPILEIAAKHGLFVIEDAAEALGAEYKGRRIGSIGHTAIFSLFGNKIITTGEGGMVTTQDPKINERIRLLRGQGVDPSRRYWHPVIGYNYRMTNIQAAIGCAQLEKIDWHLSQRARIAGLYRKYLEGSGKLTLPVQKDWARNVFWMFSVVFNGSTEPERQERMDMLKAAGIETRPFFYPMHILPPYRHLQGAGEFPVINRIAAAGINVPSYADLTEEDIAWISSKILELA